MKVFRVTFLRECQMTVEAMNAEEAQEAVAAMSYEKVTALADSRGDNWGFQIVETNDNEAVRKVVKGDVLTKDEIAAKG